MGVDDKVSVGRFLYLFSSYIPTIRTVGRSLCRDRKHAPSMIP